MRKTAQVILIATVALLILQLISALIWHIMGWQSVAEKLFGFAVFIVEGVVLPVRISKLFAQEKGTWRVVAILSLSLLYLINFMVQAYVWMILSGYQTSVRDWGGGAAQFTAFVQWFLASLFLWMSHNMWRQS